MSGGSHAVILAGGSGTRLWPLSRRSRPKQLLPLVEGASLLAHARRRLEGVFPPERIWVVTLASQLPLVAAELPDLPAENLIGEPAGRDTAAAIGLAALLIGRRDPNAKMSVFTADHYIEPPQEFAESVRAALAAADAHPDYLLTFGIAPTAPRTDFGYLERGAPLGDGVYAVSAFREKPPRATAEEYVAGGRHFWNSGMFTWRVATLVEQFRAQLPRHLATLEGLAHRWPAVQEEPAWAEQYGHLPRISIDYGVMERAPRVAMLELRCRWRDMGSWTAVGEILPQDGAGNAVAGGALAALESEANIVIAPDGRLVALLGVRDLVVVHSPDATLVARREDAGRLKELLELVRARFGARYE